MNEPRGQRERARESCGKAPPPLSHSSRRILTKTPPKTKTNHTASPTGPPFRAIAVYVNLPPASNTAKPMVGSLRFTPIGCGAPRNSSFPCSGFGWSGGAGGDNEATFSAVPSGPVPISASAGAPPTLVRVARVGLLNSGALLPADAGAAVVQASATLVVEPASASLPAVRVPLGEFNAYWTPGNPSPPNEAGVFRISQLPQAKTFTVDGVKYAFKLEGLRLQPQDRMAGTVPWPARIAPTPGQPEPPAAVGPALSVYQPRGKVASVVELVGSVAKVQ